VWWWCRYVKPLIKKYFIQLGTSRRLDRQQLEDFYYSAIYALLNTTITDQTHSKLRQLKAKIIRSRTEHHRSRYINLGETDAYETETSSLYQLIRRRERQKHRLIDGVLDTNVECRTAQAAILRVFASYVHDKYARQPTDHQATHNIL
jgi:hypothetical protein